MLLFLFFSPAVVLAALSLGWIVKQNPGLGRKTLFFLIAGFILGLPLLFFMYKRLTDYMAVNTYTAVLSSLGMALLAGYHIGLFFLIRKQRPRSFYYFLFTWFSMFYLTPFYTVIVSHFICRMAGLD